MAISNHQISSCTTHHPSGFKWNPISIDLMDIEKVKVVNPILDGGRLRRPQTKMGISSGLWTFDNHLIFKIAMLRREFLFSPEPRLKSLQKIIFPLKNIQRVEHWMLFPIFLDETTILLIFYLYITYSNLHKIVLFVYRDTFWPPSVLVLRQPIQYWQAQTKPQLQLS